MQVSAPRPAGAPTFTVRKKVFSNKYYVIAKRGNGSTVKVARFHDRSAAEYWVAVESEAWLIKHPSFQLEPA